MDLKSFSDDTFDPKDWINRAYAQSNPNEHKEVFVNKTLSTLQLYMQQLNHSLEETTTQVTTGLRNIIHESEEVEASAKNLRLRANNLEEALAAAQQAAGLPLLTLQRTDRLKTKLENARQGLLEADKWAAYITKLEGALESGKSMDLPVLTKLIKDMNDSLEMLSGSNDHEEKRIQLDGLKNRLEAVLSPGVVEAFTSHQTEKCKEFWKIFDAMGRKQALSVYRARCEDGALRSQLPSIIAFLSPPTLRDLHALLLRHATHQLEWAPAVCPGEETVPWLVRLYTSILSGIEDNQTQSNTAALQLDQTSELLAACDHFAIEMSNIINKENGKKGTVYDDDISKLGKMTYFPVRCLLEKLGNLLASAMGEDLGPKPVIEISSPDIGTVLQLRISRGLRTLISRLNQGKIIARGSARLHLIYAAQWLIDELCVGWSAVDNLTGCLSLMKASSQLQHLAVQANEILDDTKEDEALVQKQANLLEPLKNWKALLTTDFTPIISSAPLHSAPDKLRNDLKQLALKLVLAPIYSYLDNLENLPGWSDNDQFSLDLPDFSLSPQEYITQVGQYLMTLPQHLEPLMERGEVSSTEEDPAYQFLNEVCNCACETLASKIQLIKDMDPLGIRKCSTDIDYLTSVLEELETGSSGLQLLSDTLNKKQAATV